MARPYQKANIPGPEIGTAVADPIVFSNIIKSSKKKLLVIGAKASQEAFGSNKTYADFLYELGSKIGADIVANGESYKYLSEKGSKNLHLMPVINIVDRLRDPNWTNLNGTEEKYDLIIVAGSLVYYISQMLATLKNATSYRTMSLDRYHHPNARFSFPNLEKEEWMKILEEIYSKF